jgi:tRNA pseudouridine55 synthase
VGSATRIAEHLTGLPKRYEATVRFGVATDTDDPTGEPVATDEAWRRLDARAVEGALGAFRGAILQRPPAYSAKKIQGERAYRLARRGLAAAPEPVGVKVYHFELVELTLPIARFAVEVSSGTYIRALARDLGTTLGTSAYLTELRRTRIGTHSVLGAVGLPELGDEAAVRAATLQPLEALAHLPTVKVDHVAALHLSHGRSVPAPAGVPEGARAAVAWQGRLHALADVSDGALQPRKVFA